MLVNESPEVVILELRLVGDQGMQITCPSKHANMRLQEIDKCLTSALEIVEKGYCLLNRMPQGRHSDRED